MRDSLENLKKENGITLVALVITVVIMLILAGVAIAAIVDGDGLFNRTREATESYEEAARDEADQIKTLMNEIDNYLGNVDDGDDEDDNPPAGGATIGEIVDENKTFDGQAEGTFNNPIIPKGFAPINENGADWGTEDGYKKGLVITDAVDGSGNSTGNEFVWVPVDEITVKFERYDFGKGNITFSDCSETIPTEITTSITNNQGFYIARFEAGKPDGVTLKTDGSVKPVSKQGATVWASIAWSDNGTNDDTNPGNGAVTVARSMYPSSDTNYGAVSTLIYGAQWDTALRFIGAYNVGEAGYNTYAINSIGMGNYSGTSGADDIDSWWNSESDNSGPAKCGARDGFRQKNIYDMAGNVYEWTMEKYSTRRVSRGGLYFDSGSDYPASFRGNDGVGDIGPNRAFRVVLYIK